MAILVYLLSCRHCGPVCKMFPPGDFSASNISGVCKNRSGFPVYCIVCKIDNLAKAWEEHRKRVRNGEFSYLLTNTSWLNMMYAFKKQLHISVERL